MFHYSDLPHVCSGLAVIFLILATLGTIQRYCPIPGVLLSPTPHRLASPGPGPPQTPSQTKTKVKSQCPSISYDTINSCIWIIRTVLSLTLTLLVAYIPSTIVFQTLYWYTGGAVHNGIIDINPLDLESSRHLILPRYKYSRDSCLTDTSSTLDGSNSVIKPSNWSDENTIHGHTIWINEYMAVGHAMYDMYVLQILAVVPIDRIVLQRAACATDDLCEGIGTWLSWYEGFYGSMIQAFRPNTVLYVRDYAEEDTLKPMRLHDGKSVSVSGPLNLSTRISEIKLDTVNCFEHVYTRQCNQCFYGSVKPEVVERFKAAAYDIVNKERGRGAATVHGEGHRNMTVRTPHGPKKHHIRSDLLVPYFLSHAPIVVTVSYRGRLATRQVVNIDLLIQTLKTSLPSSRYVIQVHASSNANVTFYEQVALVATSHIVIAGHGAFQSNVIYMRKNSLLVDLRGAYVTGEFRNYEALSDMFGVMHKTVVNKDLAMHKQYGYHIDEAECKEVVDIVLEYGSSKPYLKNLKETSFLRLMSTLSV